MQLCSLLGQPCFVVRTKRDIHIRNWADDRDCDASEAREAFLQEVREDVRRFKARAATTGFIPNFDDFIVSAVGVRSIVKGRPPPQDPVLAYVDEEAFLKALGILEEQSA